MGQLSSNPQLYGYTIKKRTISLNIKLIIQLMYKPAVKPAVKLKANLL